MTVHLIDTKRGSLWPVPRFGYSAHVLIIPLDYMPARVVDLHMIGISSTIEYDVRYFADSKEYKIRVFEDELAPISI